jgi:plastocyanin
MTLRIYTAAALTGGLLLLAAACGGSNPGGPTTTTTTTTTTSTGGTNLTITISNNAVSPKTLTVPVGSRVTFRNADNTNHDMESDPHPDHIGPLACTEINQVGFLTAGQSRETGNLNTVRTCTYHDHNQDTNTNLQGTIIVQ